MRRHIKKYLQLALGWTLLLAGIAGLFLPILQGVLMILLGLMVLSWHMPWAERLLHRLGERFPKQHALMHEWAGKARQRWHAWWHRGAPAPDCQGGCGEDKKQD
jgi:uncharacterized membrane protein YbaN (DUF454 family)